MLVAGIRFQSTKRDLRTNFLEKFFVRTRILKSI